MTQVPGTRSLRAQGRGTTVASFGHLVRLGILCEIDWVIVPSDMKTFLIKRAELLRWKQKQIDEMEKWSVVLTNPTKKVGNESRFATQDDVLVRGK